MFDIILTASFSFIITFLAIPVILQLAEQRHLYDIPDERKLHTRLVTPLGGVGIFSGFILASLLSIRGSLNPEFQSFFAAAIMLFFLGLRDDLMILPARKKFVVQIIAASILIHLGGIRVDGMHGLFGFEEVSESFGLALSYLTIIVVINAFNLIDGVDGLAGSLGILNMLLFGVYFFAINQQAYALLSFSMAGSLVAFMIFNHHPAKIFMGDSGSLMIGLVNATLVIKFINIAGTAEAAAVPLESAVAIGFAILSVPLLDTLRVFTIRIINGRTPFTPDRNHVHHLLLDNGLGHRGVTFTCLAINISFILLVYLGQSLGPNYLLLIMLVLYFSGMYILYYRKPRRKMVISRTDNEATELRTASKVVTLTKESPAVSDN
jgi:UDP-N-acetylmuramyl pentapeptide phosphotransferase/UDP-N-acetylglucosamine-1-phosphate transferase